MQAAETIETEERSVKCDGGGGSLGHPAVFLNMGEKAEVDCPYCGRKFVLSGDAKHAH